MEKRKGIAPLIVMLIAGIIVMITLFVGGTVFASKFNLCRIFNISHSRLGPFGIFCNIFLQGFIIFLILAYILKKVFPF